MFNWTCFVFVHFAENQCEWLTYILDSFEGTLSSDQRDLYLYFIILIIEIILNWQTCFFSERYDVCWVSKLQNTLKRQIFRVSLSEMLCLPNGWPRLELEIWLDCKLMYTSTDLLGIWFKEIWFICLFICSLFITKIKLHIIFYSRINQLSSALWYIACSCRIWRILLSWI
jgi:hypothetical protein